MAAAGIENGPSIDTDPIEPIRFDVRDLDASGDPRVDLDAFVNTRWRAAHPVPADRSCWDAFAILGERALRIQAEVAQAAARTDAPIGSVERIVGDFWRSGLDATPEDRALLDAELARIDTLDTPDAIAGYIRDRHARGCGVVFGFEVEPDFDEPGRMIAYVFQGGLGLPDRDDYADTTRRQDYETHVAAMLALSGIAKPDSASLAADVIAFESELAESSVSRRALARDIRIRYRPVTLREADRADAAFPWSRLFATLGIEPPAHFSLAMSDFHAKVARLLTTAPASTWRAYLRYHTLHDAAPLLDDAIAEQHHRFHEHVLRGRAAMTPRWKRVLEAIDVNVGEAMGELYVARCFVPQAKRQVRALTEQLRAALRERLERIDWMSASTRETALRKLDALSVKIGYPDRWRDWSALTTTRAGLYANVLAARAFNRRREAHRIGKPTDRSQWRLTPQTVNAGYDPQRNEIVFPAAILAPPFFDPAADAALNYGGIGAVIAHEMIHGYDDQGSRFGANGRFENWWADDDRARFDALASHLAGQFDALPIGDGHVDGRLTLGENIADFGGVAVAFDALRHTLSEQCIEPIVDGYTQAQRFFFNWATIWRQSLTPEEASFRLRADVHAPARLRANAAPSNMSAYADAFDCAPDDPMCRPQGSRVDIW